MWLHEDEVMLKRNLRLEGRIIVVFLGGVETTSFLLLSFLLEDPNLYVLARIKMWIQKLFSA